MTMSRVALFGFDSHSIGGWLQYTDRGGFTVVAVANHRPESARALAGELGVPLFSSLGMLYAAVPFHMLTARQRLEGAKETIRFALARGTHVQCEVVPENPIHSPRIALLGYTGLDALAMVLGSWLRGLEPVAIAGSDISEIPALAGQLGMLAYESLPRMLDGGGFSAVYMKASLAEAEAAIDCAVPRGITVICEVAPGAKQSA